MKPLKLLLVNLFVVCQLQAQIDVSSYVNPEPRLSVVSIDTLELARTCAYQKDFEKADNLLIAYNATKDNFFGLGLHAQIVYWMKDFDRSIGIYEKALQLFPQPSSLYLDYARVLFSLNKFSKSSRLLKTFGQFDSTNAEADIMLAYLDLWNGKTGSAGKKAMRLLERYPGNAEAKDILNKISEWSVPYSKIGTQILSDDQPLKGNEFYAEGGVYKSWLFEPIAQAAVRNFKANDSSFNSLWIQLGNTISLGMKTKLKVKGGLFTQNSNSSDFTGSAEVSQQLPYHFSMQVAMEKRPYQYTISSVKSPVMENVTSINLNYNRNDKWFGKAAYDVYHYEDANKVHVAYLWILAPILSTSRFSLSGGYAFRYADALKSTLVSKQSIPEIINNWPPTNGIQGVYNPYFTPENQSAHSVLASVKINPAKRIQFTSNINIAFSAKADNPYLYLDAHDNGLMINRGFAQVNYTPITLVNQLNVTVSSKFSLATNYTYDNLLYYKSNRVSLELKYVFLK